MTTRPGLGRRRGLTIIEAVLAMLILSIVVTTLVRSVSGLWRSQTRMQQTLAAAEISSRVMLQFLDDRTALDSQSGKPLEYGVWRFRWELNEEQITYVPPPQASQSAGERATQRGIASEFNRMRSVTVRAWLSEDHAGGSYAPLEATPQYSVTRLVDPLNLGRTPDSIKKVMNNPELLNRILSELSGTSTGTSTGSQGGPGGRTSNQEGER